MIYWNVCQKWSKMHCKNTKKILELAAGCPATTARIINQHFNKLPPAIRAALTSEPEQAARIIRYLRQFSEDANARLN